MVFFELQFKKRITRANHDLHLNVHHPKRDARHVECHGDEIRSRGVALERERRAKGPREVGF